MLKSQCFVVAVGPFRSPNHVCTNESQGRVLYRIQTKQLLISNNKISTTKQRFVETRWTEFGSLLFILSHTVNEIQARIVSREFSLGYLWDVKQKNWFQKVFLRTYSFFFCLEDINNITIRSCDQLNITGIWLKYLRKNNCYQLTILDQKTKNTENDFILLQLFYLLMPEFNLNRSQDVQEAKASDVNIPYKCRQRSWWSPRSPCWQLVGAGVAGWRHARRV